MNEEIHGFRAGRGTRTDIMHNKFWTTFHHQQRKDVCKAFIDIKSSYDQVDRQKLLHILQNHGVDSYTIKVLKIYWDCMRIMMVHHKVRGKPFHPTYGIIQGDPLSPFLFNIVIDTALKMIDKDECPDNTDISEIPEHFREF